MELNYIKETGINQLKANIKNNIEKEMYIKNHVWLDDYLEDDYLAKTGILVNDIQLLVPEKSGTETDLENCKRIYKAMKHLTYEQATEERIWSYLTHSTFWDYMRKRWPVEVRKETTQETFINTRYFLKGSMDTALVRNGIARLWWIAHSTYDESSENPFYLTELLFKDADIQIAILERSFSRNTDITKNILKSIHKYSRINNRFPNRHEIRELMKHINRIGGTKILDMLDYEDIECIVEESLSGEAKVGALA
jgi:hypothetical protein